MRFVMLIVSRASLFHEHVTWVRQDEKSAEKKRVAEAWTAHKSDDGQATRLSLAPAA